MTSTMLQRDRPVTLDDVLATDELQSRPSRQPDYPAEIRAPVGTLPGVSSFQIQFSDSVIFTPGDISDVLVAMNPAALKVNIPHIKKGGLIIVNESVFNDINLRKASWKTNPLLDETLKDYSLIKIPLSELTKNALKEFPDRKSVV